MEIFKPPQKTVVLTPVELRQLYSFPSESQKYKKRNRNTKYKIQKSTFLLKFLNPLGHFDTSGAPVAVFVPELYGGVKNVTEGSPTWASRRHRGLGMVCYEVWISGRNPKLLSYQEEIYIVSRNKSKAAIAIRLFCEGQISRSRNWVF